MFSCALYPTVMQSEPHPNLRLVFILYIHLYIRDSTIDHLKLYTIPPNPSISLTSYYTLYRINTRHTAIFYPMAHMALY